MKKTMAPALALALALFLTACGGSSGGESGGENTAPPAQTDAVTTAPEDTGPGVDTGESADDYVYESDDGWQITIPAAIKDSFEIETVSEGLKDCFINVTYGDITALCVSIVEVLTEDDLNSMDSVRTIPVDGRQWAIGTTLDVSYVPDEGFDSTESQEYLAWRENLETFTDFQRAIIDSFRATDA